MARLVLGCTTRSIRKSTMAFLQRPGACRLGVLGARAGGNGNRPTPARHRFGALPYRAPAPTLRRLVLSRWIVDPRMPANALSKRNVAIGAAARLLLAAFACLPAFLCAHASDAIVVNADRYRVETGRYSPFAVFQGNLQRILDDCGKGTPHVVAPGEVPHGRIGTETRLGVQRALSCAPLHEVPADSPARTGAITEAVWRVVMPDVPVPSFRQRTEALVLSFEATDFGEKPEWNFCQDSRSKSSGEFDPKSARSRLLQRERSLFLPDLGTARRHRRAGARDTMDSLAGLETVAGRGRTRLCR